MGKEVGLRVFYLHLRMRRGDFRQEVRRVMCFRQKSLERIAQAQHNSHFIAKNLENNRNILTSVSYTTK